MPGFESQQDVAAFVMDLPVGVYRTAPDGEVLLANRAFARMHGFDDEKALLGRKLEDFCTSYPRQRFRELMERDGEVRGLETSWYRQDGTLVHSREHARAVRDGQGAQLYYEGMVEDITGRKVMEEALQYRVALENLIAKLSTRLINLPARSIDLAIRNALRDIGRFIGADRGGVGQRSPDGSQIQFSHLWLGNDAPPFWHVPQVFSRDEALWLVEQLECLETICYSQVEALPPEAEATRRIALKDGIQSFILVPMVYARRLSGFIGFTARTRQGWTEDTVMLLKVVGELVANALERKHAEVALIRAKEQAEEAAHIKAAFLANMSHEIRTPLTCILGFTSILSEELTGEHLEFVELIQQSSRRLLDQLNSVLDLTRIEAQEVVLNLQRINVGSQVREMLQFLQPLAKAKDIDMTLRLGAGNAVAELDPTCLHRILNNLVENAVKFTHEGKVLVEVDADDDLVYLNVKDTGIGIDEAFIPRLFEEFRQESSGLTRSYEGSGLGLTITRKLVELMGGHIRVESVKGKGSLFSVAFPRLSDKTEDRAASQAFSPPPRVLVVERDMARQVQLERMLMARYTVEAVSDTETALRQAGRMAYDAVLIDLRERAEPIEANFISRMRDLNPHGTRPFLALVGHGDPGEREEVVRQGFDGVLSEPFDRQGLLASLEAVLNGAGTHP